MITDQIAGLAPFLQNNPNLFSPTQSSGAPPVAQAPQLMQAQQQQQQSSGSSPDPAKIMQMIASVFGG